MKKQSLSISIPEPCHEKWSEMTPRDKGRHCLSCQKTVVDFTSTPKVKIAEYVSENQGSMCGRFTSDQLNVELILPKPTKSWLKYAAIILGLVPTIGYGQGVSNKTAPVPSHINDHSKIGEFVKEDIPKRGKIKVTSSSMQLQSKKVTGILVDDESGEPILFGTVAIYKEGKLITGVETDIDGRFTLDIPKGAYIEATYIGYVPRKMEFGELNAEMNLIIRMKESRLLGSVIITGIMFRAEKSESWSQRQWRKFINLVKGSHEKAVKNRELRHIQPITHTTKYIEITPADKITIEEKNVPKIEEERLNIKVFPNPTSGYVNITISDQITNFQLNISDMKNELIYTKTYFANPNALDLSSLIPGAYIVSIIHQDKLIYSEKLIKM